MAVQLGIVLEDVAAIDVQNVKFEFSHFFKFLNVVRHSGKLVIIVFVVNLLHFNKVVDKVL